MKLLVAALALVSLVLALAMILDQRVITPIIYGTIVSPIDELPTAPQGQDAIPALAAFLEVQPAVSAASEDLGAQDIGFAILEPPEIVLALPICGPSVFLAQTPMTWSPQLQAEYTPQLSV